jgi:hypothetical protein
MDLSDDPELNSIMSQINLDKLLGNCEVLSLQDITLNNIYNNLHLYNKNDYLNVLFSTKNNPKIIKLLTQYLYTEQKLNILIQLMEQNQYLKYHIYNHMFPSLLKDMLISDYFLTKFDFDILKFNQVTYNLFESDFCWNNCIISGGILSKIIFKMDINDPLFISSDIDLYLYGSKDDKINKLDYIIKYFSEKYKSRMVLVNRYNLIELFFKGVKRKIQIICTNYYTPLEIVLSFDFSYVRLCFDGKNCWVTDDFIHTYETKNVTTKLHHNNLKHNRIYKIIKLGLKFNLNPIECNKDMDFILNDDKIIDSVNNYYYPQLNEEIYTIINKMCEKNIIKTSYQVNNYNFIINWNLEFNFKSNNYFNYKTSIHHFEQLDIDLLKYNFISHYCNNILYFKKFYIPNGCTPFEIHHRTNHIMDKNLFFRASHNILENSNNYFCGTLSLYNHQQKFNDLENLIQKLTSNFLNYQKNEKVQDYWRLAFKYKSNISKNFSFEKIKSPLKFHGDSFWVNAKLTNNSEILNHKNDYITLEQVKKYKKDILHFELTLQLRIQYIYQKNLKSDETPSIRLFVSRLKFLNI